LTNRPYTIGNRISPTQIVVYHTLFRFSSVF